MGARHPGRLDLGLVADGRELQADCLGAAALFGAVADGTLELEEGDEKEMVNSLSLLADEMAWTMTSDHGDPFQRVEWFTIGRNGGVQACLDAAGDSRQPRAPSRAAHHRTHRLIGPRRPTVGGDPASSTPTGRPPRICRDCGDTRMAPWVAGRP